MNVLLFAGDLLIVESSERGLQSTIVKLQQVFCELHEDLNQLILLGAKPCPYRDSNARKSVEQVHYLGSGMSYDQQQAAQTPDGLRNH